MGNKEEFLKKLLATFKIEAEEHLHAIAAGLIELEKNVDDTKCLEITEVVFREAHSLKGAARSVNLPGIENICQAVESVFAALKHREIVVFPELLDVLHKAVNALGTLLASPDTATAAWGGAEQENLLLELKNLAARKSPVMEKAGPVNSAALGAAVPPNTESEKKIPPQPAEKSPRADMVKISAAKLGPIFLQAEELLLAKLAAGQRATEAKEAYAAVHDWEKDWKRVDPGFRDLGKLLDKKVEQEQGRADPRLRSLIEFLSWNQAWVQSFETKLAALAKSLTHDYHFLGSRTDNLLDHTKKMIMVPFSSLVELFPKFVRDLARDQHKEVEVVIRGEDIEIDRRILEEMKDPLIHLAQNCIAHGIEKPEERERKNKPRRGTITISVAQKNSHVEILVADDGNGIRFQEIKTTAIRLRMISAEEARKMEDSEAISLLFRSGVSTSPILTNLSGRGLGLAIVREKVEKLGGHVSLETQANNGTTFRIALPLTLATFRGVIVRVQDRLLILPTTNVEYVTRVSKEQVQTVQHKETIAFRGQLLSLVRLGDVLGIPLPPAAATPDKIPAVILASSDHRVAFLVDEIVHEQEVVVKNLGKQLVRVQHIAGATVLGTGKVVPILNALDLIKSAARRSVASAQESGGLVELKAPLKKSILVAEDSITTRTLLKNILEAAGYNVTTAVDGVDAFSQLRVGNFDLVVSDVDMPRMNGFDLTSKIRSDKNLSELPVVLVTALASNDHRERGIEVGASAYLVKNSFDQSNLLEIIGRLM